MKKIILIMFLFLNIFIFSEETTNLPVYIFSEDLELKKEINEKLNIISLEEKRIKAEKLYLKQKQEKIEKEKIKKEKKELRSKEKSNFIYISYGLKTGQEFNNTTWNIEKKLDELGFLQIEYARKINEKIELGLGASISGDLEYKNYQDDSENDSRYKKIGMSLIPVYLSLRVKTFKILGIKNYLIAKAGIPYVDAIGKNAKTDYKGEYFYGVGAGLEAWKINFEMNYEIMTLRDKEEDYNWSNQALNFSIGLKF